MVSYKEGKHQECCSGKGIYEISRQFVSFYF